MNCVRPTVTNAADEINKLRKILKYFEVMQPEQLKNALSKWSYI